VYQRGEAEVYRCIVLLNGSLQFIVLQLKNCPEQDSQPKYLKETWLSPRKLKPHGRTAGTQTQEAASRSHILTETPSGFFVSRQPLQNKRADTRQAPVSGILARE